MLMPTFLPKELAYLETMDSEKALFEKVKGNFYIFVPFFKIAADDETWTERYADFMRLSLEWASKQFAFDLIPFTLAKSMAESMRIHHAVLEPMIPLNLTCIVGENHLRMNNLLFGTSSDFLHDFFLKECFKKEEAEITIKGVDWSVFRVLSEWMNKGSIEKLWKQEEEFLRKVLRQASIWEMREVSILSQDVLKRYFNRTNIYAFILMANEQEWHLLKQSGCNYLNDLNMSVRVSDRFPIGIALEFFEFNPHSFTVFENLQSNLTHLIFSRYLLEDPGFSEVIAKSPRLVGLDISRTTNFSERLYEIPSHLEELDISMCSWLRPENLKKLFKICPQLIKLNLSSNNQLPSSTWGELYFLTNLNFLNISHCHQIGDEELMLILKAAPRLTDFALEECTGLSDKGFFSLAKLTKINVLDVSRCGIGDIPLIEIATRCLSLHTLNLTRCENLSDRGLLETVIQAKGLRVINIAHCLFGEEVLEEVKRIRPDLNILKEEPS